jgi:hypothetical protein
MIRSAFWVAGSGFVRGSIGVRGLAIVIGCCLLPATARAQSVARFSLDSAASIDLFRGQSTVDQPNVILDVTGVVRLGGGWLAYVRPWFRQPRKPGLTREENWDKQIYQAALQYERAGTVSTRIDAGYIASPIGFGMMDTRPGINPTIAPHLSYVTPMPAFDPGAPRVDPIAATYPLGGQLTLSTTEWDARVAVVDSAPTRIYVIHGATNPHRTPVIVTGGGFTPKIGLRVGASFATGCYVLGSELTRPQPNGRDFRMVTIEGEYAFGYTKLTGELVHDRLDTAVGTARANAWFVQGVHTLSPRFFVAGRLEGVSAPPLRTATVLGARTTFQTGETTLGYRLAPEFTLRASFMNRKPFTRTTWDQQFGASVVWAHRWW